MRPYTVAVEPSIASRVMEVRVAYAAGDFEWDITEKLVGSGRYCSTFHKVPCNSRNEGSICV